VWMGYPNKRVEMTDVHGVPQQGGYLPAEIWHAYMAAVTEGQSCTEFPQPKEAISYQPFYGKFASTGQSQATQETEKAERKAKKSHKPGAKSKEGNEPGGSQGNGNSTPGEPPTHTPPGKIPAETPAPPAANEPAIKKTGGASPG
jgi:membrane carboxypeptidase/penicillin-binding protein